MAFTNVLSEFPITKTEPLPDILKRTERLPFGGTDCSLPILHAIKQKLDVDVFVVMTDSETCKSPHSSFSQTTCILHSILDCHVRVEKLSV